MRETNQKYLYLPLEIVVREHDGKMALAHEAARAGWTVVLGPKLPLYALMEQLPEGVFLIKSATPGELPQIKALKESGHKVCSLDEEGVVTFKEFLRNDVRFSGETVTEIDRIFFWGPTQKEVFDEAFGAFASRGVVTGSPRLEFWRDYAVKAYAPQVEALQQKYERYILIPSSFGIGNNILGGDSGLQLTKSHTINMTKSLANFMIGQAEQNLIAFKEYLDFLPEMVAQFPDMNFILRPHPSEAHGPWQEVAAAHPNFHLVYEGSVTPWILGSEAIFHFKSTTSIEAHLMGTPVLTYLPPLPPYMEKYELELPLAVSKVAKTRAEVLALIQDVKDGKIAPGDKALFGPLKDWIHANDNESSAARILQQFDEIVPKPLRLWDLEPKKAFGVQMRSAIEQGLCGLYQSEKTRRFLPRRLHKRLDGLIYGARKYEGLDIELAQRIVATMSAQQADSGAAVQVEPFSENLFLIRQAG